GRSGHGGHPELDPPGNASGWRQRFSHQAFQCGRSPQHRLARSHRRPRMELTITHQDTLTELINIGYGRAAAALSELTGRRIILEVPRVAVYPIQEVNDALNDVLDGEVASVHQVFSGPVSGNALLLLDKD